MPKEHIHPPEICNPDGAEIPLWDITPQWPLHMGNATSIRKETFPSLASTNPAMVGKVGIGWFTREIPRDVLFKAKDIPLGNLLLRQRGVKFPSEYVIPQDVLLADAGVESLNKVNRKVLTEAISRHNDVRPEDALKADLRYPDLNGRPEKNVLLRIAYLLATDSGSQEAFPNSSAIEVFLSNHHQEFNPETLKDAFEKLVSKNVIQWLLQNGHASETDIAGIYKNATVWLTDLALAEIDTMRKSELTELQFPFTTHPRPQNYPDIEFAPYLLRMTTEFLYYLPEYIPEGKMMRIKTVFAGIDKTLKLIHRMAGKVLLESIGQNNTNIFDLPYDLDKIKALISSMDRDNPQIARVQRVYEELKGIFGYLNQFANRLEAQKDTLDKRQRPEIRQNRRSDATQLLTESELTQDILDRTGGGKSRTLYYRLLKRVRNRQ